MDKNKENFYTNNISKEQIKIKIIEWLEILNIGTNNGGSFLLGEKKKHKIYLRTRDIYRDNEEENEDNLVHEREENASLGIMTKELEENITTRTELLTSTLFNKKKSMNGKHSFAGKYPDRDASDGLIGKNAMVKHRKELAQCLYNLYVTKCDGTTNDYRPYIGDPKKHTEIQVSYAWAALNTYIANLCYKKSAIEPIVVSICVTYNLINNGVPMEMMPREGFGYFMPSVADTGMTRLSLGCLPKKSMEYVLNGLLLAGRVLFGLKCLLYLKDKKIDSRFTSTKALWEGHLPTWDESEIIWKITSYLVYKLRVEDGDPGENNVVIEVLNILLENNLDLVKNNMIRPIDTLNISDEVANDIQWLKMLYCWESDEMKAKKSTKGRSYTVDLGAVDSMVFTHYRGLTGTRVVVSSCSGGVSLLRVACIKYVTTSDHLKPIYLRLDKNLYYEGRKNVIMKKYNKILMDKNESQLSYEDWAYNAEYQMILDKNNEDSTSINVATGIETIKNSPLFVEYLLNPLQFATKEIGVKIGTKDVDWGLDGMAEWTFTKNNKNKNIIKEILRTRNDMNIIKDNAVCINTTLLIDITVSDTDDLSMFLRLVNYDGSYPLLLVDSGSKYLSGGTDGLGYGLIYIIGSKKDVRLLYTEVYKLLKDKNFLGGSQNLTLTPREAAIMNMFDILGLPCSIKEYINVVNKENNFI